MQDFVCLYSHLPITMPPIHPFCQLLFSIMFPMFWFLTNARVGVTECHLLDIPKVLLSSHILSSMLEINVYSIIDSKVFGVKIGINFPHAIVK
jgi:hypothetical protein